ncbi:MAG: YggS family pyridoxal phosphate-dependent enzyme [Clostridiales bacterium]|nr:YggS family pyridoxal phosphate-dependent enzyme [Clostridiales bacterium]
MVTDELKRNIDAVQERIARASASARSKITLVAAVKTVPPETINAAIKLGVTDIGENRVQEYTEKRDSVCGAIWHFIGTLQRNKAKYLVGNVALIQSVNSEALAAEIDRLAKKRGIVQDVLVEINAADEHSKTGANTSCAEQLIEYCAALSSIRVRGLMAVPPRNADKQVYIDMRRLFDAHKNATFDTLSVGMSGDYEQAIEHGSNMVRIGTAIFGQRKQ